MKGAEIEAFESRYDYKLTAILVAIDALSATVHQDNPIAVLTIPR